MGEKIKNIKKEKNIEMRRLKNKGITLVALVVTIIVLLILAGVSINLVLGDNGIIQKAQEAKHKTTEDTIKEEIELLLLDWNIEKYADDNEIDIEEFLNKKIGVKQVTTNFGLQNFKYKGYKITVNEKTKKVLKMEKTTEDIFVSANGQLHVEGSQLVNQYGHDIQLKGINIWAYDYQNFNEQFFRNIKEKYGVNCVRLALNSLNPDNEELDEQGRAFGYLYNIIDAIIENDMYAILDWHLINGGGYTNNPYDYEESAEKVFTTFAKYYKNVPNLMYELANEPKGTWDELIPYYNNLITKIREISPNCVIFATSAGHGLDVKGILSNPLKFENVMYTMHFYNSSYYLNEIKAIGDAVLKGLPIFVSEWSPTNGSSSTINFEYANLLTCFMNNYNISSTFWVVTTSNITNADGTFDKTAQYESMAEYLKYAINYISNNYVDGSYNKYIYSKNDYTMQNNAPLNANSDNYGSKYQSAEYREKITSINFEDTIKLDIEKVDIWDLSETGLGTVIGYIVEDEENPEMYKLYICSNNDRIYFPERSNFLFVNMKNVTNINNMNIINTSYVTSFLGTFRFMNNLQEIDISNFDTSKVTNMGSMFSGNSKLQNIKGIEEINISNVNDIIAMFDGIGITKLDLSKWKLNNNIVMNNLFQSTGALKELDISTWDFSKLEPSQYENLFLFSRNVQRTIYVKDEYSKSVIETLNPASSVIIK